VYKVK